MGWKVPGGGCRTVRDEGSGGGVGAGAGSACSDRGRPGDAVPSLPGW